MGWNTFPIVLLENLHRNCKSSRNPKTNQMTKNLIIIHTYSWFACYSVVWLFELKSFRWVDILRFIILINYRIRLACTLNIHNEKRRKFHMKYYILFPMNWDVHSCFKQQHTTILLTGHKNPCIINLTIHHFWIWYHTNASLSLPYKNRFSSKQLYLFLGGRPYHFRDKWNLSKTIRIIKTNEVFGIYLKYTYDIFTNSYQQLIIPKHSIYCNAWKYIWEACLHLLLTYLMLISQWNPKIRKY